MVDYRYLYFGASTRIPGVRKIGIAKDVDRRWAEINRSIPRSRERILFYAKVLCAEAVEQTLLWATSPFAVKMPGSGGTEWRWIWFLQPLIWLLFHFLGITSITVIVLVIFLIGGESEFLSRVVQLIYQETP